MTARDATRNLGRIGLATTLAYMLLWFMLPINLGLFRGRAFERLQDVLFRLVMGDPRTPSRLEGFGFLMLYGLFAAVAVFVVSLVALVFARRVPGEH